ncbi:MAG: signal peptide peptidase SppA [Candidatus Eiseniibacteriota bacterium]
MSRTTVLLSTLAATLSLAPLPVAAVPTPELPLPLFGNESVAATDGAWGFTLNPAAGGLRYPAELLAALTVLEPSGRLYRGAYSHGGAGLAGSFDDGLRAWTLGFGGGQDRLRGGLSVTRLRQKGGDGRATDYKVGLLSRPVPWASVGAVADHLFQTRYLGELLGREYTLGIGLRPLALSRGKAYERGPRLTLTADLVMAEAAARGQARVRLGAEMEVRPGLVIRGAVQDHGGFQLGFGLLGAEGGYHGSAAYARDHDRLAVNHAISLHRGEERSAFTGARLRRVATVRVGGVLGDDALPGFGFGGGGTRPSGPIHRQLERALEDPLTRGVLLDLRGVSNMAQLEELRPRIARLRRAGKPVVAYLESGGGRGDLYLAAACDRVVASEEAYFAGLGLRTERRYYRGLLEDWGIRIDRSSHGRYKSAYRGYSVDSTPKEDREVIERNLDVTQELFVSAVAADRRMERARLLAILDGRRWAPRELARAGLVDSIGYREDALRVLGRLASLGDRPRTVDLARVPAVERAWTVPARVAVVYASGAIETGRSGNDLLVGPYMGAETVVGQLERAFRHPEVRAVVLRVESPGGSGLASNLIDHAAQRLKRETKKPLIVSMGAVAGSGGYYISVHGDHIFADRHTRTGSIGVLTIKPSLEGWLAKHDVRQDEFERGRYMRGHSTGRDWDREIQAAADSAIRDYYRGFVAKVADGRGLEWAQVDSVAQGRVWMGEDALRHRLVDEIGGLEAAVAEARRRAGLPAGEKIRLLEFRRPRPWLLERLAGSALSAAWARAVRLPDPDAIYYLADAEVGD